MALTKIVVTIGPSSEETKKIVSLIRAGASVFRFNLKHGNHEWHSKCIKRVEKASKIVGKPVAILLDLQGPEMRIGKLPKKGIKVKKQDKIIFTREHYLKSFSKGIPVSESFFQEDLAKCKKFFIDEGRLEFEILKNNKESVLTESKSCGTIYSQKGINVPNLEITSPSLLVKDIKDLSLAAKHEIDYLALSFVRNRKDIELLKNQVEKLSLSTKILAKIETRQALENFEEILSSCNGIMIARGDLGMEIPLEQVPYYQKKIIKRCVEEGKPVITATQMLQSMCHNSFPTRAEVSDVANAVLDYTDAVMFASETTIGKYPLETVEVTEKICRFWEEKRPPVKDFKFNLNHQTSSVCYSAYKLWMSPFCQKEKVRAFVAVTRSGLTAQILSSLRPNLPILALTDDKKVKDQLCLLYGVTPFLFKREGNLYKKRGSGDIKRILSHVKKSGYFKKGEKVIVIYAEDWGTGGKTSVIRIQELA
jgi:pyruvate kinase